MALRSLTVGLAALIALQNQPPFRSGVELIRLDVSVLDREGRPIRDLQAGDFTVRIDGKPRQVSFARFYGPDEDQAPRVAGEDIPGAAVNTGAARGRVLVLVVDLESMEPGYERGLLEAAAALVDSLAPGDSVGLLPIPGQSIELTRDHRRVREALKRLHGVAGDNVQHQHVISVQEAEAILAERTRGATGSDSTLRQVAERECIPTDTRCSEDIRTQEAPRLLMEVDRRIQSVVRTISDLTGRLSGIDAPRTIVLISAGLPFHQKLVGVFNDLRRQAAESGISTYVLQVEQPAVDATREGLSRIDYVPKSDLAEGLSTVAGMTGGTYRAGIGRAVGVFDRIRAEIVHTYQLGVQSVPADADGKPHRIAVDVRRDGAAVHARRELIVSTSRRTARTAVEVLGFPPGAAEIPMAASAFTTRGEKVETLKVILLVEALGGSSAPGTYAMRLTGADDDRTAFETADAIVPDARGGRALLAAQVAPARYWFRAAVADRQGRAGSVEKPLEIRLYRAGPLECSDLLVGTGGEQFAPAANVPRRELVTAFLELYGADEADFSGISVDFEVRDTSGAVAGRTTGSISEGTFSTRRVADARFDLSASAPGAYVASALVKKDGRPLVTIRRAIWLL